MLTSNGRCDDQANIPDCDYDTNECCGPGNYDFCTECKCLDPKKVHMPRQVDTSCKHWAVKGNGYCDDEANIFGCDWDGGDCCGDHVVRGKCDICACKEDTATGFLQCETNLMFDGQCDVRNQHHQCSYDGFDCCLNGLGELDAEICPSYKICQTHLFENGVCDQANNKASCLYDLGECSSSDNEAQVDCIEILKGDGVCDLWNSKDQCDFDGGDCSSTNNQELLTVGLGSTNVPSNRFTSYYPNGDSVEWIPRLPKYTEEALLFTTSDKSIYICGGKNPGGQYETTCYMYSYDLDEYTFWTEIDGLIESRFYSANIVMFKDYERTYEEYLWVTGGQTGFGIASTKTERLVVTEAGARWEGYEDLPIPLSGHCIVALGATQALIAGGSSRDGAMDGDSFLFDANKVNPQLRQVPWTRVGSMSPPRKHHLCQAMVYKGLNVVVALGGINSLGESLNSADMYYQNNQVWGSGPMQLPKYLTGSSLVRWYGRFHLIGGSLQVSQQKTIWTHHVGYNWRRSSIVLRQGLTKHVSWTLKADDIKQKEHTMILLVGGMLQSGEPAPIEAFCLQGDANSVFNELCDSQINIRDVFLNDYGTGLSFLNPNTIKLNGNSLLVCGGRLSSAEGNHGHQILPRECQKYNAVAEDFTLFKPNENNILSEARNGSAFSFFGSQEVAWITGGFRMSRGQLEPIQSTEIIDTRSEQTGQDIVRAGPELPYPLAGHCSVYVGNQLFFFIGGYDSLKLLSRTFVMRISDGYLRLMPPLPKPKSYHTCFTLPMNEDLYIMVIGGGESAMETFSFKDRTWKRAQDLCDNDGHCYQFMNPQVVVTPQTTYLFATHDVALGEPSNLIFTLACGPEGRTSCKFNKIAYKYTYPRSHFTAYPLQHENHFDVDAYLKQTDFLNFAELTDWNEAQLRIQEERVIAVFGNTLLNMRVDPNDDQLQPMFDAYFPMEKSNVNFGYKSGPFELTYTVGKSTFKTTFEGDTVGKFELIGEMPKLHRYGASVVMQDNEFWVIGGYGAIGMDNSTHYLKDGAWYEGPEINDILSGMCAVNMFDEVMIIIGGQNGQGVANSWVTAYKIYEAKAADYATKFASLLIPRRNHACIHFQNRDISPDNYQIIVAGGIDQYGTLTAQVELFVFAERKWKTIEPMPYVNSHGAWIQINYDTLRYFPGIDMNAEEEIRQPLDFDIRDRQRFLFPFLNESTTTTTTLAPMLTFKSSTITTTTTTRPPTTAVVTTGAEEQGGLGPETTTTTTLLPFWLRTKEEEATQEPTTWTPSWSFVDNLKLYRSKKVEEPNTFYGLITPLVWKYDENFFIKKYAK